MSCLISAKTAPSPTICFYHTLQSWPNNFKSSTFVVFFILCTTTPHFKKLLENFSQLAWNHTCLYLSFSTFENTTDFYHLAIKQDIFTLKERKLFFLLPQYLVNDKGKGAEGRVLDALIAYIESHKFCAFHFQMKSDEFLWFLKVLT